MATEELVVPRQRSGGTWSMRPLLLRLHFYAGVLIGPFLLVAAFSGLLYTATPQLEQLVYDRELHVPASPTSFSLADQVKVAEAALPAGTLGAVRPAPSATDTTQVIFNLPGQQESFRTTVFVDPHTTQIRGVLPTYGSGQALPLRTWIDQLHRNLHLGDVGRVYSELAASWLWVVVSAGLALWWYRRRRVRRAAGARARSMTRHAYLGSVLAIALLGLSATGLTWSQFAGENITALRAAMSWQTPELTEHAAHAGHGGHADAPAAATGAGLDEVYAAAARADVGDPVEITLPVEGGAYLVQQVGRGWPTKQDSAAVDPGTGEVTDVLRFADFPLVAKLATWGIDAHMGLLFGLANQILLASIAIGLITLIVFGYRMWWQRRESFGFGRAFGRGALRGLPMRVLLPLVLVVAVLAWWLPLFGLSLAGFLIVDAIVGRVRAGSSG